MKILVVNLGSTSFKFKLFDVKGYEKEILLAKGGVDRVGSDDALAFVEVPAKQQQTTKIPDHATAIEVNLAQLCETAVLGDLSELSAIGFKAVHGGPISGAVRVDETVIETMQRFSDVTPAHNPMYIAAMQAFAEKLPDTPLVACFETSFHQTMPEARKTYAIPLEWTHDLGVRRYGFHGASHSYIAYRSAKILGRDDGKVISCHLGGSSSVSAIKAGKSIANSFGIAPQSGLPHNNRVGDLDPYALIKLRKSGLSDELIWTALNKSSGLLGISGVSNDMRDIVAAAESDGPAGQRANLAIEVFVLAVSDYIGSYLMQLGGADMIVLTGGIGENNRRVQSDLLQRLRWLGVEPDLHRPSSAADAPVKLHDDERRISADGSAPAVWILPTNEELMVARQTANVVG